jgi:hypothetical protein
VLLLLLRREEQGAIRSKICLPLLLLWMVLLLCLCVIEVEGEWRLLLRRRDGSCGRGEGRQRPCA